MYWAWKSAPLQLYADTTDRDVQNDTARWSVEVGVAADRFPSRSHTHLGWGAARYPRVARALFEAPLGNGVVKGRDRRRAKMLCALRNSVGCAVRATVTLSALFNRRAQSGHLPRPRMGWRRLASSRVNWRWMAGSPATTRMSWLLRNTERKTSCGYGQRRFGATRWRAITLEDDERT
jgi:hypothetical protein